MRRSLRQVASACLRAPIALEAAEGSMGPLLSRSSALETALYDSVSGRSDCSLWARRFSSLEASTTAPDSRPPPAPAPAAAPSKGAKKEGDYGFSYEELKVAAERGEGDHTLLREGSKSKRRLEHNLTGPAFAASRDLEQLARKLFLDDELLRRSVREFIPFVYKCGSRELHHKIISWTGPSLLPLLGPLYAAFVRDRFGPQLDAHRALVELADMRSPQRWFPFARALERKIIYHAGPTNSGKTYRALQALKQAKSGVYCGPLRLLAMEIYDRLNAEGVLCDLITGQERRAVPGSSHIACTIEMTNLSRRVDVAVLDEIQMIGDDGRGWAWTRALLGLPANEIHLCGDTSALELVDRLCRSMGEQLEVRRYDRITELRTADRALLPYRGQPTEALKLVQPGDCVVAFSRTKIFAIKEAIELLTGLRACVVYGALPPETRRQQAKLFNEEGSGYDVLVASDAVGMGLNLNIRRVIFWEVQKFDREAGAQAPLSVSSVKQIAGRAGRFGTAYSSGEVTTVRPEDLSYVKQCIGAPIESMKTPQAGLYPDIDQLERFAALMAARQHGSPPSLHAVLREFAAESQLDPNFFFCSLDSYLLVSEKIAAIPGLSLRDQHAFTMAPVKTNDSHAMAALMNFARLYANGHAVPLDVTLPLSAPTSTEDLMELETLHHVVSLWLWLSYRFPEGCFPGRDGAEEKIARIVGLMDEGLVNIRRAREERFQQHVTAAQVVQADFRRPVVPLPGAQVEVPEGAGDESQDYSLEGAGPQSEEHAGPGGTVEGEGMPHEHRSTVGTTPPAAAAEEEKAPSLSRAVAYILNRDFYSAQKSGASARGQNGGRAGAGDAVPRSQQDRDKGRDGTKSASYLSKVVSEGRDSLVQAAAGKKSGKGDRPPNAASSTAPQPNARESSAVLFRDRPYGGALPPRTEFPESLESRLEPPEMWQLAPLTLQAEEGEADGGAAPAPPAAPLVAAPENDEDEADAFSESILDQEDEPPFSSDEDEKEGMGVAREGPAPRTAATSALHSRALGALSKQEQQDLMRRLHVLEGMQLFVLRRNAINRTRAQLQELYGTGFKCIEQHAQTRLSRGGYIVRPTEGFRGSPAYPSHLTPNARAANTARELEWALGVRWGEGAGEEDGALGGGGFTFRGEASQGAKRGHGGGSVTHENVVEPLGSFMVSSIKRTLQRRGLDPSVWPSVLQTSAQWNLGPLLFPGTPSGPTQGGSVFSGLTTREAEERQTRQQRQRDLSSSASGGGGQRQGQGAEEGAGSREFDLPANDMELGLNFRLGGGANGLHSGGQGGGPAGGSSTAGRLTAVALSRIFASGLGGAAPTAPSEGQAAARESESDPLAESDSRPGGPEA